MNKREPMTATEVVNAISENAKTFSQPALDLQSWLTGVETVVKDTLRRAFVRVDKRDGLWFVELHSGDGDELLKAVGFDNPIDAEVAATSFRHVLLNGGFHLMFSDHVASLLATKPEPSPGKSLT
jgi:hypothetical protein